MPGVPLQLGGGRLGLGRRVELAAGELLLLLRGSSRQLLGSLPLGPLPDQPRGGPWRGNGVHQGAAGQRRGGLQGRRRAPSRPRLCCAIARPGPGSGAAVGQHGGWDGPRALRKKCGRILLRGARGRSEPPQYCSRSKRAQTPRPISKQLYGVVQAVRRQWNVKIMAAQASYTSVSGPRGSFGDGRAMRTAVASKFRQSAGDGTLRIGEMRGSHPCAWHSAAATCGAAVALSALASLLGDWGRSPQQAGACLTLWSEVPEENWPFLLKILAMSVMGAGDALAMSPRRLPSFSQPWLAMAFGQSPARAVFWPDFASIWRFRQLSETLSYTIRVLCWHLRCSCCASKRADSS